LDLRAHSHHSVPHHSVAHHPLHHRGHTFDDEPGDFTGMRTDGIRQVRIARRLLCDNPLSGEGELAVKSVERRNSVGRLELMQVTSVPRSTCEYIDDTCACSSATRSGESDSVVVRTPPGMSSTLRLSSVCRMNMFMYLLMSMLSTPPKPGPFAWPTGASTMLRRAYPKPSSPAPVASVDHLPS
jgi:hypothetical protein